MRVLFAWEVGGNFGHVTQIVSIAEKLAAEGAEIFLVLKRPEAAAIFAKGFDYKVFQAPFRDNPGGEKAYIYSDALMACGYEDPKVLAGMVRSWRSLYDLIKPDALVVQAAPTAVLAGRDYDFPTITFGRGYDTPPVSSPLATTRYWEKPDKKFIKAREQATLSNINKAMGQLKLPKLKFMAELLQVDASYLCSIQEAEHYPNRKNQVYHGPFFSVDTGEEIQWKEDAEKRIFAYIRPEVVDSKSCFMALNCLPESYDIVVASPGMPRDRWETIQATYGRLRITDGPVRLDNLLPECDLVINNASAGTTSAILINGIPLVMLPSHLEQMMVAKAVERSGAGLAVYDRYTPDDAKSMIEQVLTDPKYAQKAKSIKEKYKDFTQEALASKISRDISELASKRKSA